MIIEVKAKPLIKLEPPRALTPKNVVYWSEHYKRLEGFQGANTIRSKAVKFVELGLISYDPESKLYDNFNYWEESEKHDWICKPLPNNHLTYRLTWNNLIKDFECTCQYYQTKLQKKEESYCSHNLALWLYIKINNWNKKNGIN